MLEELTIFLDKEIKELSPRAAEIIEKRFLSSGNTLESVGQKFSITRERVRQIQDKLLDQLKVSFKQNKIKETKSFKELIQFIDDMGGIRKESLLLADLGKRWNLPADFKYKLRLISFLAGEPKYFGESKEFYSFYYLNEKEKSKAFSTIKNFLSFCHRNKKKVVFSNWHLSKVENLREVNYLSISKKIGLSVFGDIGPSVWPEINPKNTSEKAYLVLRKENQPLHFKKIVQLINQHFKNRAVLTPSVHNELIKDARFVLVGRGVYALAENGFKEETTRETIKRILREEGPLSPTELISLIRKEKFFKKRTILFNLQNRKYFERLSDGRYILNKEI